MPASPDFEILIIIGAPRSGTNMLRDVLTNLPGFGTWPCDEINYIWRYGNARRETDELALEDASEATRSYIRKKFSKIARKTGASIVVEKTCANCLRIPFVSDILPAARFLWIQRDGRDAVASAVERWQGSLDIPYALRKLRFIPLRDLPEYLLQHSHNRLRKIFSRDRRLAFWGPRCSSLEPWLRTGSIHQIAAMQWSICVEEAEAGLKTMDRSKWHSLKYERFVAEPVEELQKILEFLNVRLRLEVVEKAVRQVSRTSVGRFSRSLESAHLDSIKPLIREAQKRLGYPAC